MSQHLLLVLTFVLLATVPVMPAVPDGPADNLPDRVRPVPPPGVEVPAADRAELEAATAELGKVIDTLDTSLQGKPGADLIADVRIFHNAVRYALAHNEIFDLKEIPAAREILRLGRERADQLLEGKAPWLEQILNPERYVVLNSGFTFREYDYLNNARQAPKLPDWAVVDLGELPSSRRPGRIAAAGFFGESWELLPDIPADGRAPEDG